MRSRDVEAIFFRHCPIENIEKGTGKREGEMELGICLGGLF